MKRLKQASFLLLLFIIGCASLGLPTPTSYNERLAAAYGTITTVRSEALTLLVAKKITPTDAQNVQAQADTVRSALDISHGLFKAGDVAGANTKLTTTLTMLTALQSYLAAKKGTK